MAAVDDDSTVRIERKVCIRGGGCKRMPWIPAGLQVLDGIEFVALSKSNTGRGGGKIDTGFIRFCLGQVRSSQALNNAMDKLREHRMHATLQTVAPTSDLFEQNERAKKRQRAQARDAELPTYVTLAMPEFDSPDGIVRGIDMKVVPSLSLKPKLCIELREDVLTYIHKYVQSFINQADAPHDFGEGVRWRKDRGVWVGQRNASKKTKQFMPVSKSAADLESSSMATVARTTKQNVENESLLAVAKCS